MTRHYLGYILSAQITHTRWSDRENPAQGRRNFGLTEVPTGVKSLLFVTMMWDDLLHRIGTASTIGAPGSGTRIDPETARRLACDASIIPVALGSHGEILDLGRQARASSERTDQSPMATRQTLHLPRLRRARVLDRRTSPAALGRRRPLGSVQPALLCAPPRRRPPRPARRHRAARWHRRRLEKGFSSAFCGSVDPGLRSGLLGSVGDSGCGWGCVARTDWGSYVRGCRRRSSEGSVTCASQRHSTRCWTFPGRGWPAWSSLRTGWCWGLAAAAPGRCVRVAGAARAAMTGLCCGGITVQLPTETRSARDLAG